MRLLIVIILGLLTLALLTQCMRRDDEQEKKFKEKKQAFMEIMPGDTFYPEDWNDEELGFKLDIKEKTADQFIYSVVAYPNDQMKESELWHVYTKIDNEIIRIQKE